MWGWWSGVGPTRRSLTEMAVASTTGGTVFVAWTMLTQAIGGLGFGIVSGSIASSMVGAIAVGGGCLMALWTGESAVKMLMRNGQMVSWTELEKITNSMIPFRTSVTENVPTMVQFAGMGCLWFQVLGGRFRALFPSDYTRLGAFRHGLSALKGALRYAVQREKGYLDLAGKWFGCHTCGVRSPGPNPGGFIADHQPPLKFAKRENQRFYRRWTGLLVKQDYYPQCQACSLQQSMLVRTDEPKARKRMRFHFGVFRKYHLAGAVAVGTGMAIANIME